MVHRFLAFLPFFLLSALVKTTYAQDGHYWTEQYGVRTTLLGGAVIGSATDLSAVFYNPGRLALLEEPTFLLSAEVYEWQRTKIEDAVGENQDLTDNQLGGVPSMFAGSFSFGKHRLAYSFLNRHRSELDFLLRTDQEADIIDGVSGEERFNGEVDWEKNTDERWLGLTWSYSPRPRLSVGVTQFITSRIQSDLFKIQLQALTNAGDIAFLARNREQDFFHFGLLWKAGLALDLSPWSLGLTVTTPKLSLAGSGYSLYEDFFSGIETDEVGAQENVFISNLQEGLAARHRSPWSIGFGTGLRIGKSSIHLGAEWYLPVREYAILTSEPFVGQSSGDTLQTRLVEARSGVFNIGLGAELVLSDRLSLYGSARTDFSAVDTDINRFVAFRSRVNSSVISADLFHVAAGGVVRIKRVNLTLGLTYAFANQEILRPVDLPEERGDVIFGSGRTSTVYWRRWRLIFGFSVPFAREDSAGAVPPNGGSAGR